MRKYLLKRLLEGLLLLLGVGVLTVLLNLFYA